MSTPTLTPPEMAVAEEVTAAAQTVSLEKEYLLQNYGRYPLVLRKGTALSSLIARLDGARPGPTILLRAGIRVEEAENGRIALEKTLAAREAGQPFDIVFMDMQMPEMDGYEATHRLRQSGYLRPIVALRPSVLPLRTAAHAPVATAGPVRVATVVLGPVVIVVHVRAAVSTATAAVADVPIGRLVMTALSVAPNRA